MELVDVKMEITLSFTSPRGSAAAVQSGDTLGWIRDNRGIFEGWHVRDVPRMSDTSARMEMQGLPGIVHTNVVTGMFRHLPELLASRAGEGNGGEKTHRN